MERAITKAKAPPWQKFFLSRQDISAIFIGIFGFFIGRTILFEMVNPVAMGFLANFLAGSPFFYITTIFTAIGIFTKLPGLYFFKYAMSIGMMTGIHFFFSRRRYRPDIVVKSVVGGVVVLLTGVVFAVFNGFSLYFALMALLEGVLAFLMAFVLKKSVDVVAAVTRKRILTNEDMISTAILMGAVIAGASDIHFGGVSLRLFMSTIVILAAAYKGRSALGATTGLLLGFMLYVLGFGDASSIAVYAMAGTCAGALRNKGKLVTTLGFVLGGGFVSYYLSGALPSREMVFSAGTGALAFFMTPAQFYFNVDTSVNPMIDNAEAYIDRVKEITADRLTAFAGAFGKLSKAFSGLSEKRTSLDQGDVSKLIDDIAAKACAACSRKVYCWEDHFYDTYQTIFGILGACERKSAIEAPDIPDIFRETCVDLNHFTETANRLYELGKMNLSWRNRIVESRELVSQQLLGVSSLIKNLADELDLHINFKEDLEAAIIAELNKNKIEVKSVIVLENKAGKYEVTMNHTPCQGKRHCTKNISPVISKVLGRKMKPAETDCTIRKGRCVLRLVEEQKFRMSSGVARACKTSSRQSGDSYSFMELKNGQCLMALSDGMGSGNRAKAESAAAIELLEDFVESGFEKEMAVKMINSALVLKSSEESFSTLDICAVDLYSGNAEFIKIGAATTYLLRNGVVQVIQSTSLPIGILNTVDLEVCTKILKSGDIIVMVTDGLTEIPDTYEDKGAWIIEALCRIKSANPQEIADTILSEAERKSDGYIRDDMTVLAAKIWEKKNRS